MWVLKAAFARVLSGFTKITGRVLVSRDGDKVLLRTLGVKCVHSVQQG